MEFGKIKFFFKTMLESTGLSASTTDLTGIFDVDHIFDWLEVFLWKAADTVDPATITFDAGVGNAPSADYLGIRRHNLGTLGASIALQNSTDNFASDVTTIIADRLELDTTTLIEACIIANWDLEAWPDGVTSAPTGWTLSGAGASVDRESTIVKVRNHSAKVTRSGADAFFFSSIPNFTFFQNRTITLGKWVNASVANQVRLRVNDGPTSSSSAFHSGTPGFEFLTVTHTVSGAATQLQLGGLVSIDGIVYFDGAVMKEASSLVSTDRSDFIQPQSNGKRYWRLKITDDDNAAFSAPPSMAIAVWGDKVELDHTSLPFDPNAEEPNVNISRAFGGAVTGVHTRSIDRAFTLGFMNKNAAFYAKVDDWWQTHGQQQFFVGWNTKDYPDQIGLMFPDGPFRNPRRPEGENEKRDVIIDLRGVKE